MHWSDVLVLASQVELDNQVEPVVRGIGNRAGFYVDVSKRRIGAN